MNPTTRHAALALSILAPLGCEQAPTAPELPIDPVVQEGRVGSPTTKPAIAFVSTRDDEKGEIYLMDTDGTNTRRLTNDGWRDQSPAISPDGRRVAYASKRGPGSWYNIIAVDVKTLTQEVITNTGYSWSPTWSPDGSQIAYVKGVYAGGGYDYEIYVSDADGSNVCSVSNDPATDVNPDWSPDGSLIAFRSDRDVKSGDPSEIYVVEPLCGATPVRVTHNTVVDDMPSWSPAGDQLAVSRRGVAGSFLIAVLSYPTGSEHWITPDDGTLGPSYFSPTWSHDGSQIAFGMTPLGSSPSEIQVKSASGTGPITTLSAMDDFDPDWAGAGKW